MDIAKLGNNSNLRIIKFGILTEIKNALSLYCEQNARSSEVYWPVALRRFCMHILTNLRERAGQDNIKAIRAELQLYDKISMT